MAEKTRIQNRLKELRQKSGLTLDELAIRAGTSQPQIFRLERGERDMSLEWIARLSKALHCRPYELLPQEWQPTQEQKNSDLSLESIGEIIETVEEWLNENKKSLEPRLKAQLIKALYEETHDLPQEDRSEKIRDFTKFLIKTKAS